MKKCLLLLCLLLCFTCLLCACDETDPSTTDGEEPETTHVHKWSEWVVYTSANCIAEGEERRSCSSCREVEKRVIPVSQEHTFTQKRMTQDYECTLSAFRPVGVYYYKCHFCDAKGTNTYIADEAYIYFGEYPQSLKAENVTITETTDSRGYFLGSDGAYYAKVTATPYDSGYTFSTGDAVISGTVYYFKVEPILWRILSKEGSSALILCDSAIDNKAVDTDDTVANYKDSDIRVWLNDQFYNTAFNAAQQEMIEITSVDNTPAAVTEDKVFLLSRGEVGNAEYGFSSNEKRMRKPSDYIRANGARMDIENESTAWWLRNFKDDLPGHAFLGYLDGRSNVYAKINTARNGIVPALKITFP